MDYRKERGLRIAKLGRIKKRDGYYLVPSQSQPNKSYKVRVGSAESCDCPDFSERGEEIGRCKHLWSIMVRYTEVRDGQGNTVKTSETRITYSQNWPAYDRAQTTEKTEFMKLLNDLCGTVEQPAYRFGRPSLPMRDMVFAAALKVYTTFSLRRFASDMKEAQQKGYIAKTPHYSRVAKYMESEKMTPILYRLVQMSALPLASVETDFAVDSSGFSTSVFSRWFDHRWGKDKTERVWLKAHISVGVRTNVVTAVKVTEGHRHDSNEFVDLIEKTAKNFKIAEVSADKAYSSKANIAAVVTAGGTPFIPFKRNARPTNRAHSGKMWKKMYHYFQLNQEEFLQRYHKRSNVETTFSMVKRKFGGNLRSKTQTAQVNEVLLKLLCHNICVVSQEI